MRKALRISWLVVAFFVLLPAIIVFEIAWLVYCIRAAKMLNETVSTGVEAWIYYLKQGLAMNADFVKNGL